MLECSVIICTHNPRTDYLRRALDGLIRQTLSKERWELLLIDNASENNLVDTWDLSWHPFARHIREEELGLTPARMRGIQSANGKLLVFVDDDNILAENYLEAALSLSGEFPQMGAFGSSKIIPLYETRPSPELEPHCDLLALRNSDTELWANLPVATTAVPFGAGLCVRRKIAQALLIKKRLGGPILDRKGKALLSAGDIEFSLVASDTGFGHGIFPRLQLTHLISAKRVERDYLLRLNEGMAFSNELLSRIRNRELGYPLPSIKRELRLLLGALYKILASKGIDRQFSYRSCRGQWMAFQEYRRLTRRSEQTDGVPI